MIDRVNLFADLGYTPHAGQWPIHLSSARRRVCSCGVRFGKTTLAAYECVAYALEPKPRSIGWIVAPTYELSTRVFREVAHVFLSKLPQLVIAFREHDHMLRIHNLGGGISEVRGKSADAPVSLLGEGLDFVVVDEIARIKADIWERHLSQRLVDKDGHALLISTPRGKGFFYDLFRRGQKGEDSHYESWNLPSWANPLLKRELIEAERARIPQAVFKQEFGAEWIEGAGQVFRNVRDLATGEWQAPVAGQQYFGGLDLAKTIDWTVLVIMNRAREIVHVERFQRVDWDIQLGRIKTTAERYNKCELLVDSTGKGEPVFEAIVKGGVRARAYPFTHSSKEDLVNNLALLCEKRLVKFPRIELWPEGIDELEAFQYSVLPSGTVRTGAPDGQHDDCAVATMLAAWQLRKDAAPMKVTWV